MVYRVVLGSAFIATIFAFFAFVLFSGLYRYLGLPVEDFIGWVYLATAFVWAVIFAFFIMALSRG